MTTLSGIKRNFSDTTVLSGRMMRHTFRSIDTLITVVAMPIMILLLFVYVFGGAMNTGSRNYINFVVPGIVLFTIASGIAYTAVHLNNDVTAGIFDRFYSMPISKSSILGGHVLNSVVFNMFSVLLVLLVAFVIGFRPEARLAEWLLATGLVLLFTLAMTWVAVTFGLLANSAEGAAAFSYPLLFLLFISAAFVPTASMAGIVRTFAEYQPMTPIIESVRSLLMGEPVGMNALIAVIWCMGILIAFYFAALQIYKRKIS
jgi:ABC-2 type transport system permease protein